MSTLIIAPGRVTTITLNRPDVRNAFNEALIAELTDWARSVQSDGSVRAVVLRGAGPVFCAGADLKWMSKVMGYSREENVADARQAASLYHALDSLPVPLIGRVHGAALGGGAGLAAVCDVVVATEDAMFGFTEVTLGIVPAMISPYVVRKIGMSAARELCLSGERFSAARAREIGLVHEIAPEQELDDAVDRHWVSSAKPRPPRWRQPSASCATCTAVSPGEVMALTVDASAAQRVSPEGQEGMKAFLEKRRPAWTKDR